MSNYTRITETGQIKARMYSIIISLDEFDKEDIRRWCFGNKRDKNRDRIFYFHIPTSIFNQALSELVEEGYLSSRVASEKKDKGSVTVIKYRYNYE